MPQTAELTEICNGVDLSKEDSEEVMMCIRQVSVVDRLTSSLSRPEGWGDCANCSADEYNANCKGYLAVPVRTTVTVERSAEADNVLQIVRTRHYIHPHPEFYIG